MNGFIVVDKPAGMTSHDVVNRVRRITGQKKAGHTGTLDPFATGVLPVALGEGTKAIPFLDESVKEYQALMRLGAATDTQDCTGATIAEGNWGHLSPEDIVRIAASFTGDQKQLPPMFSALKHQGTPLYKLARRGVSIERTARDIEILSLSVDSIALPDVGFTVRCSRGTYVRTLAHDMGEIAGCGAHLLTLRRLASGPFSAARAHSLEEVAELAKAGEIGTIVVSPLAALSHLKTLLLSDHGGAAVRNGVAPQTTEVENLSALALVPGEQVKLALYEKLVAVAEVVETSPQKLKLLRVFN